MEDQKRSNETVIDNLDYKAGYADGAMAEGWERVGDSFEHAAEVERLRRQLAAAANANCGCLGRLLAAYAEPVIVEQSGTRNTKREEDQ